MLKLSIRVRIIGFTMAVLYFGPALSFAEDQVEFGPTAPDSTLTEDHNLAMILAGSAAGTVGFMMGAIIGVNSSSGTGDFAGLEQGLVMGSITGGLALPLGVHAGNRGQGSLDKVMGSALPAGSFSGRRKVRQFCL